MHFPHPQKDMGKYLIQHICPPVMNSKDTVTDLKNCKSFVKNAELSKTNYLDTPHQLLLSEEFTVEVTKALAEKKACKPTGSILKTGFFECLWDVTDC